MPVPVVVVDVSPPDAGHETTAALVEACSAAFARGRCELGSGLLGSRRALVRWSEDGASAAIEVETSGSSPERRELNFTATDASIERWRAVGLVIGTLARDSEDPASPVEHTAEPKPTPKRRVPDAKPLSTERVPPSTWLTLAFATGPLGDTLAYGASLRAAHVVMGPAFASVSLRYLTRPEDAHGVTLDLFAPSLGGGVRYSLGSGFELGGRVDATVELARARARSGGRSESASRVAVGGRVGCDAALAVAGPLSLELGGDVSYIGRPIQLRVASRDVEELSPLRLTGLFGLRWGFR